MWTSQWAIRKSVAAILSITSKERTGRVLGRDSVALIISSSFMRSSLRGGPLSTSLDYLPRRLLVAMRSSSYKSDDTSWKGSFANAVSTSS